MKQQIKIVTENEYSKLKQFAEKVGVTWSDTEDVTRFFVLEKEEIAASVGFKLVENDCLLRALIIDPEQCGLGDTLYLLAFVTKEAQEMGAKAAYLMTTAPSYIFQLAGFTQVEQSEVPKSLLEFPPFNGQDNLVQDRAIMARFL